MVEPIALDLPRLEANLARIRAELESIPRPGGGPVPEIVVVTKYLSPDDSRQLRAAGIGPLGENRAGDLKSKWVQDDREGWHFIGHLQRNKIKDVVPGVGLLHSLDNRRLAGEIDHFMKSRGGRRSTRRTREALERLGRFPCLVQVNVSGEATKGGLDMEQAASEIPRWIEECLHLEIRGLMTMAPLAEAEACRPLFRQLRELRDRIRERLPAQAADRFTELSMGMSNDYRVAAEEGATLLRLGSVLYR